MQDSFWVGKKTVPDSTSVHTLDSDFGAISVTERSCMLRACLLSGESHYRIGVHTTLDSVLVSARKAIRY